jgi:hypothetical protein
MEQGEGENPEPSGPIKLTWSEGRPAPEYIATIDGDAAVHGSTAYFSSDYHLYSYTVPGNEWTKLPECKRKLFALTVIAEKLTTVGGKEQNWTNALLSLSGSSWEEILPPMPTNRMKPAVVNTPTHLVVAGGEITTVDVLNTETLQWFKASSLPGRIYSPQITACDGCVYLSDQGGLFSCSVKKLLKSSKSCSVWTRLTNVPMQHSSIATLRGHVLAIGGRDGDDHPTGAIHCYDVTTNSWSIVGEMPTPRSQVLTAVLPSDELVVAGGLSESSNTCDITNIGTVLNYK